MKKSKLARLIAAICCFAMLLAACSSNQTPAESGGDGSTTADSEKKVLTYAIGAETTDLSTLYMNNKWGALLCQKEYQTNATRRNLSNWW